MLRTIPSTYVMWALTRLWVILSGFALIPYPQSEFLFSDVRLYDWWAGNILDGHFPINDPMWQYPPLAAVIFAAGYALAHETVGFVFLALVADALLFTAVARKGFRESQFLPITIWLCAPLAMGPIFLGRFDVFPTLFACLALLSAGTPMRAGGLLAVGTLLKVWPGFGLLAFPKKSLTQLVVGFVSTTTILMFGIHAWWSDSLNFIQGQTSRGLQIESVAALPYMWVNASSAVVTTNFQYGAIEVVAAGTGFVNAAITMVFVVFLGFIAVQRFRGALEKVSPSLVMLLIVLVSMLTSRVLSPQYNLWVLGLLAVAMFNPVPQRRLIVGLIMTSAFCGQLLYPWLYVSFQQGGVFPTVVHTVRIFSLVAATYFVARAVMNPGLSQPEAAEVD